MAQQVNAITGTQKAVLASEYLDKSAIILKTINKDYKDRLEAGDNPKIGIKIPGRSSIVTEGERTLDDFALQTNSIIDVPLMQFSMDREIRELDLSTTVESFAAEILNPLKESLATHLNKKALGAIIGGVDSHILAASGKGSFAGLSDATALVGKSKVSGKRWGILDLSLMSQVRMSGANLFNTGTLANDIYNSFDIARYAETEYIGTPDIDTITYPSAFPASIHGTTAVVNGAKELPLSSAQQPTVDIPEGVLFTIAGVYRVDAEGNTLTGQLKTFVTAFTPAGSTSLKLKAPIIFTPATDGTGKILTQVKNVSALPATGAVLTLAGATGATYLRGVVYSENIAVVAARRITDQGKAGTVSSISLAGMAPIQYWERTKDNINGHLLQSVTMLAGIQPFLGLGGTAYYVAV